MEKEADLYSDYMNKFAVILNFFCITGSTVLVLSLKCSLLNDTYMHSLRYLAICDCNDFAGKSFEKIQIQ